MDDLIPLTIGDRVRLNSGSPIMLVVDADGGMTTVSWRDGVEVHEMTLPRACFYLPAFPEVAP